MDVWHLMGTKVIYYFSGLSFLYIGHSHKSRHKAQSISWSWNLMWRSFQYKLLNTGKKRKARFSTEDYDFCTTCGLMSWPWKKFWLLESITWRHITEDSILYPRCLVPRIRHTYFLNRKATCSRYNHLATWFTICFRETHFLTRNQ